ncbi:hypothetical protein CTEN210_10424 [Chaetoceros tenuissimus]|uniref:Uncharacterized protein n=1 Tax=Chaetoceros tenuissimus TaxID=426638 RepID=A0AAD3CXG0_9STRA|nr:hypothetical protein CTEN210_10424 [Chaetoceros tenuissimus]
MEKLIDREDLLTEINRPFGHTEGDRVDNIPLLLVQMEKDIERIIAAYESTINRISLLKGITNILGIKSCLTQLEISTKIGAMVDAVSCAPSLYKHAFEKQKIQNSFSTVGEITNIGSKDSPQYIACPDIDIIQKQCKITWTSDQREHFNRNLKSGVEEIMRNGYLVKNGLMREVLRKIVGLMSLLKNFALSILFGNNDLLRAVSEPKLKKGNPEQVANETLSPNVESQFNLGKAFAVKNQPVIAAAPGRAPRIVYTPSLIQPPSTIRMEARPNFNVTPHFIRKACVSISSLDDKGEEFLLQQLENIADLDDDTFSDVLLQRLSLNLEVRRCPMDHIIWKEFFIPNLKRGAAIVKMHECVLNNAALPGQRAQDSLFSNSFRGKMECLSGRDGALLDDIPDQIGAYLFEDEPGIGICRAGSASVGLRKRYNGHVVASKRESPDSIRSNFYNSYPDKSSNGGERGIKGNFEDLRQITGVRFKPEMAESIIELLEWDDAILSFLETKGTGSLLEKKTRMVCYFFEKIFDLMIGLHMNLSRNPGFEMFLGVWNNNSIECNYNVLGLSFVVSLLHVACEEVVVSVLF